MRRKGSAPAAAALTADEVAKRLEEHRKSRPFRGPLPEQLWAEAAELAVRQGVYKTSRSLRLHYGDLKKRVDALMAREPAGSECRVQTAAIAVKGESPAPPSLSCWLSRPVLQPLRNAAWRLSRFAVPECASKWVAFSRLLSRRSSEISQGNPCCRSLHRCASWSPSNRSTGGRALIRSHSCAASGSRKTPFPVASFSFSIGAAQRCARCVTMARAIGWPRNGCRKAGSRVGRRDHRRFTRWKHTRPTFSLRPGTPPRPARQYGGQ